MDDLLSGPEPTPDEITEAFRADVLAFVGGVPQLVSVMRGIGDYRKPEAATRSIQRMMAGDVAVSGEMRVILAMLRQERLREGRLLSEAQWTEIPDGAVEARVSDFSITISPATKGRWRSNLVHKNGYSPSWPTWQHTLEDAKRTAIQRLLAAEIELDEIWAYDQSAER
jgi:hypothetical protein